jgi:hypothetical protein
MIIRAPEPLQFQEGKPSVFLAGSIEMGKAVDWQTRLEQELDTKAVVLNPRRKDWDSSWEQKKTNPKFFEQVTWELKALEAADIIAMYFDPTTKSPISLLELGLHAHTHKMLVCCPEGFWRKGNVDIVCERYNIPVVNTLDELVQSVLTKVGV